MSLEERIPLANNLVEVISYNNPDLTLDNLQELFEFSTTWSKNINYESPSSQSPDKTNAINELFSCRSVSRLTDFSLDLRQWFGADIKFKDRSICRLTEPALSYNVSPDLLFRTVAIFKKIFNRLLSEDKIAHLPDQVIIFWSYFNQLQILRTIELWLGLINADFSFLQSDNEEDNAYLLDIEIRELTDDPGREHRINDQITIINPNLIGSAINLSFDYNIRAPDEFNFISLAYRYAGMGWMARIGFTTNPAYKDNPFMIITSDGSSQSDYESNYNFIRYNSPISGDYKEWYTGRLLNFSQLESIYFHQYDLLQEAEMLYHKYIINPAGETLEKIENPTPPGSENQETQETQENPIPDSEGELPQLELNDIVESDGMIDID